MQVYPFPVLILEVPAGSVRFANSTRAEDKLSETQEHASGDGHVGGSAAASSETAAPKERLTLPNEALKWVNHHWRTLASERSLSDFLDQTSLEQLSSWATDGTRPTTFTLQCGSPRISLSLTKSHVEDPGKAHFIVVTSQILGFEDSSSGSTQSSDTAIVVERDGTEATPGPSTQLQAMSPPSVSAVPSTGETVAPVTTEFETRGPSIVAGHEVKHDISDIPRTMDPKFHEHLKGHYQISTTELEGDDSRTSCRELFGRMDWTGKPCGPPETWSPAVRALVDVAFDTVTADAVYIGTKPSNLVSI